MARHFLVITQDVLKGSYRAVEVKLTMKFWSGWSCLIRVLWSSQRKKEIRKVVGVDDSW